MRRTHAEGRHRAPVQLRGATNRAACEGYRFTADRLVCRPPRCVLLPLPRCALLPQTFYRLNGTFQIPVDSFEETSGDARMVICIVNPEDSSPSSTNQRPCDAVYQTPRFSSPDPYPYRHARVAASRCLRENDAHRQLLSDIPHLSLPTAVGCQPPVGSAL